MTDSANDRFMHIIDEITQSYDKLRQFESEGCSKKDLEKLLIRIRDVCGEIPSMFTLMFKENPSTLPVITQFVSIFKPPFLQTLHMHLMTFAIPSNPDSSWIKTQIALAIGYLNGDGWIDTLKAMKTFLRNP